jgi:recombination protein RecR
MENDLERLIAYIAKLPGIGKRSAKRVALHLLKNREGLMLPLSESLKDTASSITSCKNCGNYDVISPCSICMDEKRDHKLICIVEDVSDLWAMDRGSVYNGLYHILGGVLSAIDGVGPEDLRIDILNERVQNEPIEEVIIATNATIEGQTTAHYIYNYLSEINQDLKITRIAHGIPLGGELDFLDEGTISTALKARKEVS